MTRGSKPLVFHRAAEHPLINIYINKGFEGVIKSLGCGFRGLTCFFWCIMMLYRSV